MIDPSSWATDDRRECDDVTRRSLKILETSVVGKDNQAFLTIGTSQVIIVLFSYCRSSLRSSEGRKEVMDKKKPRRRMICVSDTCIPNSNSVKYSHSCILSSRLSFARLKAFSPTIDRNPRRRDEKRLESGVVTIGLPRWDRPKPPLAGFRHYSNNERKQRDYNLTKGGSMKKNENGGGATATNAAVLPPKTATTTTGKISNDKRSGNIRQYLIFIKEAIHDLGACSLDKTKSVEKYWALRTLVPRHPIFLCQKSEG